MFHSQYLKSFIVEEKTKESKENETERAGDVRRGLFISKFILRNCPLALDVMKTRISYARQPTAQRDRETVTRGDETCSIYRRTYSEKATEGALRGRSENSSLHTMAGDHLM